MIDVTSVYQDVRDNLSESENSYFGYAMFNRMSRRAELRLIDWLSGDIASLAPPIPYLTQKNKDWLGIFMLPYRKNLVDGSIPWPKDYYRFESMRVMDGPPMGENCGEEPIEDDGCRTPIDLLDSSKFDYRCRTFIEEDRPSMGSPIARIVGRTFQFSPRDLGNVELFYIRYPKFGSIVSSIDPTYNQPIANPALSTNYEWDEFARELLVWFITDSFTIHNREQALKQQNALTGKTAGESKQ